MGALHPGAAQFMFVVDAFVLNVAIPSIRAELHATICETQGAIVIRSFLATEHMRQHGKRPSNGFRRLHHPTFATLTSRNLVGS